MLAHAGVIGKEVEVLKARLKPLNLGFYLLGGQCEVVGRILEPKASDEKLMSTLMIKLQVSVSDLIARRRI